MKTCFNTITATWSSVMEIVISFITTCKREHSKKYTTTSVNFSLEKREVNKIKVKSFIGFNNYLELLVERKNNLIFIRLQSYTLNLRRFTFNCISICVCNFVYKI